jgi:hypothetical protein
MNDDLERIWVEEVWHVIRSILSFAGWDYEQA